MKKIILYILGMLLLFPFVSCRDRDTEGISKITTYAVLKINGDEFMTINKGTAFTDPGFTAKIGDKDVASSVKVTGTVDSNTPGVYILTYQVANEQGYSVSKRRWVGVIAADAVNNDISGTYVRTNGVPANVVKIATGLYTTNNVGGVNDPSYIYPIYIFNTTGNTLVVPTQPNPLSGDLYCTNITFTGTQIKWVVMGAGYGTSVRTFNKQ